MTMSGVAAGVAAAWVFLCPALAMAADSSLVLILGGEAYDGPPKFEVMFDGKPLGQGAVAAAIDTATAGRFADASDKTKYVQSFTFAIPEGRFRPDAQVRVRFTNEAYGGEGSNRDRNLYLASVSVNGRAVTASGLETLNGDDIAPNMVLGEFLVLADGTRDAASPAPSGGWPQPSAGIATPAAAPVTEVEAIAATEPMMVANKVIDDTAPAKIAGADDGARTIATNATRPDCDLDQRYNVIGFNENSNALTPRLVRRLEQIAADIGDRQCKLQVTGYSSKQGSDATNALFAVERAQNTLRYLRARGLKFTEASATGVGATDQFGPTLNANRRVVIIVTP